MPTERPGAHVALPLVTVAELSLAGQAGASDSEAS